LLFEWLLVFFNWNSCFVFFVVLNWAMCAFQSELLLAELIIVFSNRICFLFRRGSYVFQSEFLRFWMDGCVWVGIIPIESTTIHSKPQEFRLENIRTPSKQKTNPIGKHNNQFGKQ
jgi:hypothetical protein